MTWSCSPLWVKNHVASDILTRSFCGILLSLHSYPVSLVKTTHLLWVLFHPPTDNTGWTVSYLSISVISYCLLSFLYPDPYITRNLKNKYFSVVVFLKRNPSKTNSSPPWQISSSPVFSHLSLIQLSLITVTGVFPTLLRAEKLCI